MLNKLKNIPLLDNVHLSHPDGSLLMQVGDRAARGYLCTLSLTLAIFIDESDYMSYETARYITVLLARYPEIHDYALQLTGEGGWLCCYYSESMTTENMAAEIEKQLAITRYLGSIISCQRNASRDGKYEKK